MCNHDAWGSEDQDKKGKSILYKKITVNIESIIMIQGAECRAATLRQTQLSPFLQVRELKLSGLPKATAEFVLLPVHTVYGESCYVYAFHGGL